MKFKITLLCLAVFFGSFIQHVAAQNITVSGKVKNKVTGEALIGATVSVEGSSNATVADAAGNFSISVKKGGFLVVSYSGMDPFRYKINKAGVVEIMMEEANKSLTEVVVIGYGVQKVTKVSGAISTVKSTDIQKLNPVRLEEALQGSVSGINVIQSGSPGTKPTVLIRGIPSYGGNDPTVIVDGVQQTLNDLNSINPSDIETINVLKDAAATAIYGVKGGNGVIVVTTKSGHKNQKTEISINGSYSIQEVAKTIPVLNASEYGAIINEGSTTSGGNIIFPNLSVLGKGTNWQKEIFHQAPVQTYNISVKGGSDKISYFLGGGYLSQGGILGGYDKSKFNRLNFTSNLSFDITSKLKFVVNATYLNLSGKGVQENSFNSIIGSALNFDPTVPVYNNTPNTVGKYGYSNLLLSEIFNPLTKLDNTYNKNTGHKLYGKFEIQYEVIKNLRLTTRFGYTKYDGNAKSFTPLVFYGPLNVDNSMNADGSTVTGKHNSVSHEKTTYASFNYELFGNYNFKVFRNHNFETTIGIALSKESGNVAGASKQDVPFNSWEFADFTAGLGTNTSANPNQVTGYYYQYVTKHASGFGRINYDFKEKYLVSFTARRDGSYAFGTKNKFGNFLSGSLGWVVTKEKFFQSKFINNLKIRGSYGEVGNDNNIKPQIVTIRTDWGQSLYAPGENSIGYTFGNTFYSGATVASSANTALRWEKTKQLNVGFDMNFYKNRISISADYFQKKTDGLLFYPSVSSYLGTVPVPQANIGSTKSSGVDITLGYTDRVLKIIKVNTALTFTTVKNLVTSTNADGSAWIVGGGYFNGQSQTVTVFAPGYSPGFYYGYKTNGLFQTITEISKSPTQNGAQPGDIKFVDLNGDGAINDKDKTKIGDPFPDFTMGWNLNLTYKNFDFTAFTYASVGNDVYRAYERNANFSNKFQGVLSRWTGPGTTNDARNPRYSFTDPNNNSRVSQRFVEDGSFVKIKNLLLGYTLPQFVTRKVFKSVRVYAQVKNAFTFTKYSGFDPEVPGFGLLDTGIDRGSYPQPRTYAVGLDIKF